MVALMTFYVDILQQVCNSYCMSVQSYVIKFANVSTFANTIDLENTTSAHTTNFEIP